MGWVEMALSILPQKREKGDKKRGCGVGICGENYDFQKIIRGEKMTKEEREKYLTCVYCENPLSENELVEDAYKISTTMSWAHGRLKILSDMLEDRKQDYFAKEIREIIAEFKYLKA
jgi:hypothetical protein